ncbi:hypothetical protein [Bacillus sp. AFS088145]|uniref:hypothetical protein n=1 Tax=Bacillus sp. AFS088145 TaxID=2033514 RepID=UPI000BF407B4|nr:hypothetical protein [Bacillus sp. AFS088145]PFH91404.1 hypothetical protein COI44_02015 [Bacillus sp. AFS088145]
MNRIFFEKHNIEPELLNTHDWPVVDDLSLSEEIRELFWKRKYAIDDFIYTDKSLAEIQNEHGVHKVLLYRLINACLQTDRDGVILGYKALIPYTMKKQEYTRKSMPKFSTNSTGGFQKLLREHPELKEFIIDKYRNKRNQNIIDSKIKIKFLHKQFLEQCRLLGLTDNDYPFNTENVARRSLERYVKKIQNERFLIAAARNGSQSYQHAKSTGNGKRNQPMIIKPYQRVQFDGHKIDACIAIEFTTPEGDVIVEVMNRIWILVIIDEANRTVLGYHLCLNKEYNSDDVMKCIRNAVIPKEKMNLTIPALEYHSTAGFPDWGFKECQWGVWEEFSYDNAKANLAQIVKDRLTNLIGCSVNAGPVNSPERRGIIERFFGVLEENSFHRLPNTTGSHSHDPRRMNPEKNAKKYCITESEIHQLIEVVIANYNGTPHEGLNNLSPLSVLKQRLDRDLTVRTLPKQHRNEILFFTKRVERKVCGNVKKGIRPYIKYEGVRYRSEKLANSSALIGKTISLYVNVDDLRTIRAFLPNGEDLGELTAVGKWAEVKHDLRTRKAIFKLKNQKEIHFLSHEDPVEVYGEYLRKKARINKNARNKLAHLEKSKKEITENKITKMPSTIKPNKAEEPMKSKMNIQNSPQRPVPRIFTKPIINNGY